MPSRFAAAPAVMPAALPGQLPAAPAPAPPHLGHASLRGMPAARQGGRFRRGQPPEADAWPPPAQGNNPYEVTRGRPPKLPQGPTVLGFDQESWNRGGSFFANDELTASDRHSYLKAGTETSGRKSGQTDPPMDGPARPSLHTLNRTLNYQQGTDNTASQDDLTRDYSRNSAGMYVGTQGQGWSVVYGGVPGLYQPYGSYAGVTTGVVKGIQSPVPQGSPLDGRRMVWSGPPHGLHTQTLPDYSQTLGRYSTTPQNRPPRLDRPANSPIAGQSFSQLVLPQGFTARTRTWTTGLYGRDRVSQSGWKGGAGQ